MRESLFTSYRNPVSCGQMTAKTAIPGAFMVWTCALDDAVAQPAPPPCHQRQEVPELTDEFDRFDGRKWQKVHRYWQGRWPSVYDDANISYEDGKLKLQMTLRDATRKGRWISAAAVTSRTEAFEAGMYAEVRVKVGDLSAVSSFWMQGAYSEIDVIDKEKQIQWAVAQAVSRGYSILTGTASKSVISDYLTQVIARPMAGSAFRWRSSRTAAVRRSIWAAAIMVTSMRVKSPSHV